ncbi:probable BOI-related E3 ubiquitin-protein ligase 3 [Impatiens glandulifera]|uniref:probable BOI-related E3 ubiquitin-protein ligase 3 n=1 Tax=Impatiens glandulifera TaxID=253017 RepID=UPI001FB10679|nr:probable BOI-related E3 ubiquitin-protein ligase 3 [Impatiens glandulifera]
MTDLYSFIQSFLIFILDLLRQGGSSSSRKIEETMANQVTVTPTNSRKRTHEVFTSYLSLSPPNSTRNALLTPLLSFTSLLNDNRTAEIVDQSDEIANMVRENAEELQKKLSEKWMKNFNTVESAAEERVLKKMKEFDVEMEQMKKKLEESENRVMHLSFEKEIWEAKSRDLEDQIADMRATIFRQDWLRNQQAAATEAAAVAVAEEVGDSSSVESSPVNLKTVMLTCKVCDEDVARNMMLPCRHVSVCKKCEETTNNCPVCDLEKTGSIEIIIP